MATHIETVEQAIEVLNEKRYRDCDTWYVYRRNDIVLINGNGTFLSVGVPESAIAIAQGLIDRDGIAELKQQLADLPRRIQSAIGERMGDETLSPTYNEILRLQAEIERLRLAVQPIRDKMGAIEYLDAVDDDERSGCRPWPLKKSLTISEVRAFVAAYDGKGNNK